MSDEAILHMTNPAELAAHMAGFEACEELMSPARGWFAGRVRYRKHLRARLRFGQLTHHNLTAEETRAIEAALKDDDIAAQLVDKVEEQASENWRPFLDWLKGVDWMKLLAEVLAVVLPLILAKPAVSPYGVPEEPKT